MKWFWAVIAVLWLIIFLGELAAEADSDHSAVMIFLSIAIGYLSDIKEDVCR